MRATRRERIEAAVGGRVLGNWRSWWQTADGFRRVADSASATAAAGLVHGSLPIFGDIARDPMTPPALIPFGPVAHVGSTLLRHGGSDHREPRYLPAAVKHSC